MTISISKIQKTKKERILFAALISLGFSFNIAVFAPMDSFLIGAEEFWFSGFSILLPILTCFLAAFLFFFFTLYLLPQRVSTVVTCIFFSLNLAFYIEGNYMMWGYPMLDGTPIPWSEMVVRGCLDVALWLVIIAVPFLLRKFLPKYFKAALMFVTVLVFAMELSTLIITAVITPVKETQEVYLSVEEEFEVSKNENIITVLPDTFEAKYMRRALEEFPHLKEKLKGFTFYENTSGVSSFTHFSMPQLITGNLVPVGYSYIDGVQKTFENTEFFDKMHENGYEVNVFSDNRFVNKKTIGLIDNVKQSELSASLRVNMANTGLMYKYSAFKYMPHFAKIFFIMETGDFGQTQSLLNDPSYYFDDQSFYSRFKKSEIKAVKEEKVYSMYHLNGVHAPYSIGREMEPVNYNNSDSELSYEEQRYENALGELKLFFKMLDSMEEQGVYDKSTIIYTTDHGFGNRFDTLLMVKPRGETAPLAISSKPMSLEEDYVSLVLDTASGKGMGADFYKIDENRPRYVYNYMSDADVYGSRSTCRTKILVDGHAKEQSAYKWVEDEFADELQAVDYTIGNTISLMDGSPYYTGIINNTGWTYTGTARIKLNINSKEDAVGKIIINDIQGESQQIQITANDVVVFDAVVKNGEKLISFTLPKNVVANGEVELILKFPQAAFYGGQGGELHSFKFTAVQLESLCLEAS